MHVIRWGIMGTGRIADLFMQGLRQVKDAQVTGAASRTRANADRFAARYGIPHTYDTYEELASAEDIDVIYIATPNTSHKENALLCLHHKKHILVEKPFTVNADEAREVIEEAARQNRFCMEAMWMRFIPAVRKAREIVDSGTLGDIRMFSADFGLSIPYDPVDRVYNPALGGGSLLDLGVYPISLAWYLMGAAQSVTATASMTPSGVDEQAGVMLNYPGGTKAICISSFNTWTPHEAVISGTHGRLRIHAPIWRPFRLSVESFAPPAKNAPQKPASGPLAQLRSLSLVEVVKQTFDGLIAPAVTNITKGISVPYTGNGYQYEAMEVHQCISAGKLESSIMPLKESLQIMETMDAARRQFGLVYPTDAHLTQNE